MHVICLKGTKLSLLMMFTDSWKNMHAMLCLLVALYYNTYLS